MVRMVEVERGRQRDRGRDAETASSTMQWRTTTRSLMIRMMWMTTTTMMMVMAALPRPPALASLVAPRGPRVSYLWAHLHFAIFSLNAA